MSFVPGVGALHVIGVTIGSAIAGNAAWLYHTEYQSPSRDSRWSSNVIQSQHLKSALGASGVVMGAGAVATCLMPTAPMNFMFIPVAIPLWMMTLVYAGIDTYYLHSDSIVGHSAHLGGAIYGVMYYLAYLRNYGGVWQMARRVMRR